jgi:hypothetical protein
MEEVTEEETWLPPGSQGAVREREEGAGNKTTPPNDPFPPPRPQLLRFPPPPNRPVSYESLNGLITDGVRGS